MRILPLLQPAVLLLAATALLHAASTEDQVKAAVDQWRTAVIKKDQATLDKLIHPSVTYSHSNALMENKAEMIAAFLKPTTTYHAIDMADTTYRVFGNTALVQTKMTVNNTQNGEKKTLPLSVLMVWVKEKGIWQLAARQSTRLP
jgi:ketosteroid isomerase-like protein